MAIIDREAIAAILIDMQRAMPDIVAVIGRALSLAMMDSAGIGIFLCRHHAASPALCGT